MMMLADFAIQDLAVPGFIGTAAIGAVGAIRWGATRFEAVGRWAAGRFEALMVLQREHEQRTSDVMIDLIRGDIEAKHDVARAMDRQTTAINELRAQMPKEIHLPRQKRGPIDTRDEEIAKG